MEIIINESIPYKLNRHLHYFPIPPPWIKIALAIKLIYYFYPPKGDIKTISEIKRCKLLCQLNQAAYSLYLDF